MQVAHGRKLLIEPLRPAVFHGASRERVSLSREAKALDGLELPLGIIGVLGTFAVRNVK